MEEKRRDAGTTTAASGESPASEPTSSRRRASGHKRKSGNLGSSGSSSTPSKRAAREKSSLSLSSHPPIHNGPLTRARQAPSGIASASASAAPSAAGGANQAAQRTKIPGSSGETVAGALVAEELRKESELEALEAGLEAKFEAIRSRSNCAHVVPSHCGWFSWTKIHPIEERTLPSFFNGKSELRTAETYLEIRNWIMKKFHANPSTQIELKDLSELEVGDLDARQEVFEFLDHWGLINFHPFPPTDSATVGASGKGDGCLEKVSLADKLYHFETPQLSKPVIPNNSITAPAVPSRLFPESAIAEELVRPEGPAVEYHCNSCSADCSRKRYHCQKQADFDLCSDCFSNGKFDSGMSSSDFILMEPGEGAGLSGGKWTDQETLLLLEALELYPENWNEIAEHVATKTRAQCILHFVQMPIEDTFLDYDDTIDSSSKENADPASTEKDSSAPKDAGEATKGETAASENQSPTSPMESSKEETNDVKSGQDTSKPVDGNEVKAGQETSKPKEDSESKSGQETGEDCAIKALNEAFEAVGYPLTSEGPLSFAEVGNPVMALASFLARLVGPDLATVSAHNSMKSISGNSPGIELAARHCFVLEDPPNDNKEPAVLHSDAKVANGETQKDEITSDKKEDSTPEEKTPSNAPEGESQEKPNAAKEQDDVVASDEADSVNLKKPNTAEIIKDQLTFTLGGSDDLKSDAELPLSLVKESEGKSGEIPEPNDVEMSEPSPSEKNEPQQTVSSNLVSTSTHSAEPLENVGAVSDSLPLEKNEHGLIVKSNEKSSAEAAKDVDMVPHSEQSEKTEPPQPVSANVTVENTIEDPPKDGEKEKHDSLETKEEHKIDKIKRAAVSAISAAAVKAKLLANQEEEQIRRLSTLLIEKQLQKLETKLGFFNEMENVVMRVREQMDRSRQRLYHERAQIIAARLGLPASSSRVMPSSLPTNRIGVNVAGSVPRPPLSMVSQRPPMSRPVGTVAPNPSIPLPTSAGSSIRPPSQEKLSSVETK